MRSHHEISNQTRVTLRFLSRFSITALAYLVYTRENKCARTLRTLEYTRRFAPAKLISGYCCGIIVFAFHLSCLHICLHPSFSFRLTRLQIQLSGRYSPAYTFLLPSFLRHFSFTFLISRTTAGCS